MWTAALGTVGVFAVAMDVVPRVPAEREDVSDAAAGAIRTLLDTVCDEERERVEGSNLS